MKVEKEKIRSHFAGAAETYDQYAVVQRKTARRLLTLITDTIETAPELLLEIGCCTGYLTRNLSAAFPDVKVFDVNDIVDEFSEKIFSLELSGKIRFLAGDIEQIQLPTKYQLICSSSTFHWLHDLQALLQKLHAHLTPGGMLAFSLYGPENMREIRKITGRGLEYVSSARLRDMLQGSFEIISVEESVESIDFPDPVTVQDHLRKTGVNALAQQGWNREKQKRFSQRYKQCFSTKKGVSLTYHSMYFIVRVP
ncbi:MAG TPA: malonyl-[acyl-carrier protein] O-methyltransferase BioC [Desulfobulbus sp.]|nr:malonyl-[acyl-carrier protein] O-methyltransferase BioC [Desulfobulbus sp.]